MKKTILLLITLCFFSCKNESEQTAERNKFFLDSLKSIQLAKERIDENFKDYQKKSYLDTTGFANSPIKIISSKLVEKEYSNYKDIKLTYKNVSKKTIQAVRFEWYGENSFNEPADMGNYNLIGEGGGFSDDILKAGKTETSTWDISSKDAKKIISARAYEVAFTDGTVWKLRKD